MSSAMRTQLRISGKGNYVASRGNAQRPVVERKGGERPPSAPMKVNRQTAAVRRGKR